MFKKFKNLRAVQNCKKCNTVDGVILPRSSVVSKPIEPKRNLASQKPVDSSLASQKPVNSSGDGVIKGGILENTKDVIGVLEVYVHQAKDIQNICIYHKQDVYAKIYLTDDPDTIVSTQTVNGGGRNPVFNENLRLNVRNIESSLKCEVWMLSRIKNYLQDQFLGFALVPLTDVVIERGKLAKDFTLTSNDMFHSPSGFVQLTLAYNGASPEVLEISSTHPSWAVSAAEQDKGRLGSVPGDFGKIQFPDLKIVNENEMMVTEYYGIPCANLDSRNRKSLDKIIDDNPLNSEVDAPAVETFGAESNEVTDVSKVHTPPSSMLIKGSPSVSVVTNSPSACNTPGASKSVNQDVAEAWEFVNRDVVSPGEKTKDVAEVSDSVNQDVVSPKAKTEDVGKAPISTVVKPLISVNVEPEQEVVQQDYVDMYMKSMKQFSETLAKMNLPLNTGTELAVPKEKDCDEKKQALKESGPSARVFYGSRAFF